MSTPAAPTRRTHADIGRVTWNTEATSIETIHAAYTLRLAVAVEAVHDTLKTLVANHNAAEACYLRCWLGRNLRPVKRAADARGPLYRRAYDSALWTISHNLRDQGTLGDATRMFYLLDLADPWTELHTTPGKIVRERWRELVQDAEQANDTDWKRLKREQEDHRP